MAEQARTSGQRKAAAHNQKPRLENLGNGVARAPRPTRGIPVLWEVIIGPKMTVPGARKTDRMVTVPQTRPREQVHSGWDKRCRRKMPVVSGGLRCAR